MTFQLGSTVTCPECDTDQTHYFSFPARVVSRQDITEDDVEPEDVHCENCGHVWDEEYPGWISHDDAG